MTSSLKFPALPLPAWQPTRDTLQGYSKVLGKIRRALTPPQSHWAHVSLRVAPHGLTTTAMPMPGSEGATFKINLDLLQTPQVRMATSLGQSWTQLLIGQPLSQFCDSVLMALADMGINPEIDRSLFAIDTPGVIEAEAVTTFWQALTSIHTVMQGFKAELPGETGPVQLWSHHFDLALLWFSGRKVPGVDPNNEEYADEQMNFGFSTGDEGMPEPYFYATAYPWPEQIVAAALPAGAEWFTASWKGGLLRYESLLKTADPAEQLLAYLRAVHQAGSNFMR